MGKGQDQSGLHDLCIVNFERACIIESLGQIKQGLDNIKLKEKEGFDIFSQDSVQFNAYAHREKPLIIVSFHFNPIALRTSKTL